MLVLFYLNIHLQIVNRVVRHLSPVFLATAHTFGFSPHSARSYLHNSHATTGAFPRTAFRSVHTVETLQATVALLQTPLCSKQSTSAVSTELYERGRSEHSTPALQPVLSVSLAVKFSTAIIGYLSFHYFMPVFWTKHYVVLAFIQRV